MVAVLIMASGVPQPTPTACLGIDSQTWTALEEAGEAHPEGIPLLPPPGLSQDTHTTKRERKVSKRAPSGDLVSASKVNQLSFSFQNPTRFLLKQRKLLALSVSQCIHYRKGYCSIVSSLSIKWAS